MGGEKISVARGSDYNSGLESIKEENGDGRGGCEWDTSEVEFFSDLMKNAEAGDDVQGAA